VSTGDEERLTPLGAAVNRQDRPSWHHHHADHHVVAKAGAARRRRQGPKAARMRGRSEATSLARCRAQIEHRMRDGRRVRRSCAGHQVANAKGETIVPRRHATIGCAVRRGMGHVSDWNFPQKQHQIVRTKWTTISATHLPPMTVQLGYEPGLQRQRQRHRRRARLRVIDATVVPLALASEHAVCVLLEDTAGARTHSCGTTGHTSGLASGRTMRTRAAQFCCRDWARRPTRDTTNDGVNDPVRAWRGQLPGTTAGSFTPSLV